ncbi:hypothetical protein D910_05995 [Dendroctonus ponderosae]|uniref:Cadherin domain-containing protein n=1 Tax=Dendroctonus ponderosae TaxID=77166 RepID=U4TS55_DENPD|nr:hypothetical protein D910_00206 [Dendroctonus ponderosae]ERL84314.1 hypothetical protein D910_01730 [Dendroctonus ponderosae]ERL88610.1 hypothetical protein D910_05995 [Dendroctonus ponderosae]
MTNTPPFNILRTASRIRYEITSGNIGGAFAVKNMTGAIYVAGALDYETRKRYELTLVASDSLNENYTTVVIHIKDVNDLPPKFNCSSYDREVQEEYPGSYPMLLMQVRLHITAFNLSLGTVIVATERQ